MKLITLFSAFLATFSVNLRAQGNFNGKTDYPLRYHPEGNDFVIENGREFFNRPLYDSNTAFRVDAGDKPEFSLYLPGRGGNLKFGIKTKQGQKWLEDADKIVSRYRPGSMIYQISDSLFGRGVLRLTVLAMYETEGLIVRAELQNTNAPVELVWAYGGANGVRGRRDGDIGTEKVSVGEFFQLKPEFAKNNKFLIEENNFTFESNAANIFGVTPKDAKLAVADAEKWNDLDGLLASANQPTETPVIIGRKTLRPNKSDFFALQKISSKINSLSEKSNETQQNSEIQNLIPAYKTENLPRIFNAAENYRKSIAEKVIVETPDSYVNAAVAALNVAADGIWDESQGAFMHGAVAWRVKLLGWRGSYSGDALGWHERTRRHLNYWAMRQNVSPISNEPIKQDAAVNFARNEPELHTNGDISESHYDMNLVYIDALFRHILWTGDVEFARKMFPVIQRHLAWERRLFRRELGAEKLPLYEAYAAIWASDDLQYSGGGVTHSTAYNYYHNKMAARIAKLIGEDTTPYECEANLILKSMRENLWLKNQGWFGEYKDLSGLQKVHESAAVWTFYHAVDSETMSPFEAWQMSRYIETQIPHIPLRGKDMPKGDFYTLSTTDWMPYTWSTNNVVMAEAMHTALGFWQSQRKNEAFNLFKGALLDSMFSGICPGNAGMTTKFDMARGESQRDFADAVGTTSRALIEGLFGVHPDALSGELMINPAFPKDWNYANLKHTDFNFSFKRENTKETYIIESHFPKPMTLHLRVPALRDQVAKVLINGNVTKWQLVEDSIGEPLIEVIGKSNSRYEVVIEWKGEDISANNNAKIIAENGKFEANFGNAKLLEVKDSQNALKNVSPTSNAFSAKATTNFGHRTVFAKVKQGDLIWWQPLMFEIRPAFEILPDENQDATSLRFKLRNNTPQSINKTVAADLNGQNEKLNLKIPAFGESDEIVLNGTEIVTGSNRVSIDFENGQVIRGIITNWKIKTNAAKFETVNLTRTFNDQVTNIFKYEYLSPRSSFVSLAIPTQGIGSWVHYDEKFAVDDFGIRQIADKNDGKLILPNGIPLETVGAKDEKNVAFTSQWDNFPREISVPLDGRSSHVYLLLAGSTNQMQSRFENGEVVVTYTDNSTERLALENPTNWWAIDQDYFIDDFAFKRFETIPPRVDLKTGNIRILNLANFKGKGKKIPGGAATVLDLPLDSTKELKSLNVRALANEVVIGLMSVTLVRN